MADIRDEVAKLLKQGGALTVRERTWERITYAQGSKTTEIEIVRELIVNPSSGSKNSTQTPIKTNKILETQPINPWGYATIAFICLLISISIGYYISIQSDTLIRNGVFGPAFYILLLVMGLVVAGFLFGVMRSYATFSGQRWGGALELGGPAVGLFLVVVLGIWITPVPTVIDVTINFESGDTTGNIPKTGFITIGYENRREKLPINNYGQAVLRSIPSQKKSQEFKPLLLEASGFKLKDGSEILKIGPGDVITVYVVAVAQVEAMNESLEKTFTVCNVDPNNKDKCPRSDYTRSIGHSAGTPDFKALAQEICSANKMKPADPPGEMISDSAGGKWGVNFIRVRCIP